MWDAQKALAKGGIEDGDLCFCGERMFGLSRHRYIVRCPECRLTGTPMPGEYRCGNCGARRTEIFVRWPNE